MFKTSYITLFVAASVLLAGCTGASGDDPGVEYAPQMYHSVAYDPLSQVVDETSPYYNSAPFNDYQGKKKINLMTPVEGVVARQNYVGATQSVLPSEDQPLLIYELHKDSLDMAARILKNPVALDSAGKVIEQGKHLYLGFCAPCHGVNGQGDGKVGEQYKGVPNYSVGRYKTLSEGHIFHVITHGKGRMWPHKSQLSPEERWKVVHYVQKLQKGES
ncbi:c-type cytochrome [Rhodoflexus caldus]|uniref:c-type cytochrome n=1 Tax=Rhodoflexus caldus TaxID=2891236 RepID=UPI00202A2EF2|nr:cytochrome c [Rhodoflexus caldus]